jgi:hypothetical protein
VDPLDFIGGESQVWPLRVGAPQPRKLAIKLVPGNYDVLIFSSDKACRDTCYGSAADQASDTCKVIDQASRESGTNKPTNMSYPLLSALLIRLAPKVPDGLHCHNHAERIFTTSLECLNLCSGAMAIPPILSCLAGRTRSPNRTVPTMKVPCYLTV